MREGNRGNEEEPEEKKERERERERDVRNVNRRRYSDTTSRRSTKYGLLFPSLVRTSMRGEGSRFARRYSLSEHETSVVISAD
jgi:hypothetical protein